VIAKILERAGHQTIIVSNGEEALKALDEQRFDLVLMDLNMPVMNGLEATKLYRFTSLGHPHLPIVALTADSTPEVAQRCIDAGMDACITKPVEPARLLEAIYKIVPPTLDTRPDPIKHLVTDISVHPRFRSVKELPSIDERVFAELEALGGRTFVVELTKEFLRDAGTLTRTLADATKHGNVQMFRDAAHALRSASANIGATGLYDLCLQWRRITSAELSQNGSRNVERLTAELERTRRTLLKHPALVDQSENQS
jgi:two-component system sensor histidine kinase RpfC